MTNPYISPTRPANESDYPNEVIAPAIALIVISLFAIVSGVFGIAITVFLLLSGSIAELEAINEGPVSEYTQVIIQTIWGVILLIAATFVLYGAVKMKRLKDYRTARLAAIVALVPLVGPCCFLGIPFGIWALVVLSKPYVRDSFVS